MMKAYNGPSKPRSEWKPPPGYESAKAKAYKKWREANPRVNALGCDTDDDSDSDEERSFLIAAINQQPSECSDIPELEDDLTTPESSDHEVIAQLGKWAHKLVVGQKNQKSKMSNRVLSSAKDLDAYLHKNPSIAAAD